jgi:Holliday junction resolvasome RuvABC ATP-dependent DNA helicase subunit
MATTTIERLFPNIVGQAAAKRIMRFYIEGHSASNIIPHIMLVAPKGCGKTTMAEAFGRNLIQKGELKQKPWLSINCSSIKNLEQFFDQIVMPHLMDKDITFMLDECHMIPVDVQNALLTVLNPNPNNANTFSFGEFDWSVDFKRISFIFATTESQKMNEPLMDRCKRIDLEEYKDEELEEILKLNTKIIFKQNILKTISTTLRGNARGAQKMANDIDIYSKKNVKKVFQKSDWKRLSRDLDILPLGLHRMELRLLRALSEQPFTRLTNLAAKLGMSRSVIQRDFEMFLQKESLFEVQPLGRQLTKKGQQYLKNYEKEYGTEK